MRFAKCAILLTLLVLACACDEQPDPGVPRVPLPSEVKAQPASKSSGTFGPRALGEVRKEMEAKRAKAIAAGDPTGGMPAGLSKVPEEAEQATTGQPKSDSKEAGPAPGATPKS